MGLCRVGPFFFFFLSNKFYISALYIVCFLRALFVTIILEESEYNQALTPFPQGHDYNMFKSQAGGACDCGDSSVMRESGFCTRVRMAPQIHTCLVTLIFSCKLAPAPASAPGFAPFPYLRLLATHQS